MLADGYKPSLNESMDFSEQGEYVNDFQQQAILFQTSTDTPEFREWFGDWENDPENASKILADGKPMPAYHGTPHAGFDSFKPGLTYFSGDPKYAAAYTSQSNSATMKPASYYQQEQSPGIIPVWLNIRKPFDTRNASTRKIYDDRFLGKWGNGTPLDPATGLPDWTDQDDLYDFIQEEGLDFDGLILAESHGTISYATFNPNQAKSIFNQNPTADPRLLFQADKSGSLVVLHNTDAERILGIDDFGGLPMPSIAVTRPDIPFYGFGDSTLIARPRVAQDALKEGRLYDRDIWSPTVPSPKWKINWKHLGIYEKLIDEGDRKLGKRFSIQSIGDEKFEEGPEVAKRLLGVQAGSKVAYLEENGIGFEVVHKQVEGPSGVAIGVVAAVNEYLKKNGITGWLDPNEESGHFEALTEVIKKAALKEKEFKRLFKKDPELADSIIDRWTTFSYKSRIIDAARKYVPGATEISYYETKDKIEEAISQNKGAYEAWVAEKVNPAFSDPRIKVGGKQVPFNAESVLEWMQSKSVKSSQETMTYGPAKAAASAGREFMSREQISAQEGALVTQEAHQKYWGENIEPLTKELQEKLPEYYKYDDTWEALDTIYKSIAAYLKTSTGTSAPRMKKTLSAHGFTNVPANLVDTATEVAGFIASMPQDYYEAKPSKIIKLSDFKAAVIPASTSEEVKAGIRDSGLMVYEYEKDGQRNEMVQKAVADDPEILFQAVEEVSAKVQDALYSRGLEYSVRFSRSSLSRYYSFPVNGKLYSIRISDHPAPPQSEQYTRNDYAINVKSPVDETDFTRWLDGIAGAPEYTGRLLFKPGAEDQPAEEEAEVLFQDEEAPAFQANRGLLVERLSKPGELETFLSTLWTEMKSEYDPANQTGGKVKSPTAEKLKGHPFVMGAAISVGRDGQELEPTVRRAVLGTIRKNELAYKGLYSTLSGDLDMAQEARTERESIAELSDIANPIPKSFERMTLAEQTVVLEKIRDKSVRAKVASGDITDSEISAYIERLESDRKKLAGMDKLRDKNEGLTDALRSARQESALQSRRVAAEIRAMYRIRDERIKIVERIFEPAGKMTYEYKSKLRVIQEYLKSKKWERVKTEAGGTRKTGRIIDSSEIAARLSKMLKESPGIRNILTATMVDRINNLPYSDWSNGELRTLLVAMDAIRKLGTIAYSEKMIRRSHEAYLKREEISAATRKQEGYADPRATGSKEERDLVKGIDDKKMAALVDINMDRFARYYMDKGNPELSNWKLLVEEEREHYRSKMTSAERRIRAVTKAMKDAGYKPAQLYRKITIEGAGPGDTAATWTASDLMMMMLAMRNEDSRKAVVYGNLCSQRERDENTLDGLKSYAAPRAMAIQKAIGKELTQVEHQIAELIAADFDREFDRLNSAVIDLTEEDLRKVDNYVPIKRMGEVFEKFSDEIVQDLFARNGIAPKAGPKKGFTKRRIIIGPNNQTPIKLDLWATFLDAVDKQEHLIEYGEYHRKLVSVYVNMRSSRGIREAIKHSLGKQGIDFLDRYIAEVANPIQYKDRDYSEKLVRKLRGNLAVGYLAFRWTSVLNQLVTSPLPFIAYAPEKMLGSAAACIANPAKFIEETEAMSVILRNREADQLYEQFKQLDREGYEAVIAKIGQVGMSGLKWADRWTVAIGWRSVYDKALEKSGNHDASVKEADRVTLLCQPSSRGVDQSPLFRDNNEWKRLATQFGSQLNVVWQQLRYDLPGAAGEKRYGEAIGIIMGMALAGIAMGAIRKLRGKDEDKDETWWNDWVYYALSQSFDAVPLVGSEVAALAKRLVTGQKQWMGGSDNFPAISSLLSGIEGLSEGKLSAVKSVAEAIGLAVGAPALATEEYLGWIVKLLEENGGE